MGRTSAARRVAASLVLAVAMAGCGNGSSTAPPPLASADLTKVRLTAAELDRLAAADGEFGGQLFNRVASETPGNVVLSPASVAVALEMAYVGARGRTASEMAKVLHVTGIQPIHIAAAAATFLQDLSPLAGNHNELLSLVDQVWVQDGFPLTRGFETAMRTGFSAGMRRIDFAHDPDAARQAINSAVADQTHDKVTDLLAPGTVDSLARLVLTNAVYMHARWLSPFEPELTTPRAFRLTDGTTVQPETMEQSDTFAYVRHDGYQAVRLPYNGGRLAMTILLPDNQDVGALAQRIGNDGLDALTQGMTPTGLTLDLPMFRYTWSDGLVTPLSELGMPTAFTSSADFTGISTAEQLQIAFVQHKAFVAVDEKGTEAAAATAVGITGSSLMVPKREPIVMRVDHPFLFAITDTRTGLPLFLGRVLDPTVGG